MPFKDKRKNKQSAWKCKGIPCTIEIYEFLMVQQDSKCAICGIDSKKLKRSLSPDHCHNTGKLRGLLCGRCNLAIGLLDDDSR